MITFKPDCDTSAVREMNSSDSGIAAAAGGDFLPEDIVNSDGTFEFATRAIEFENEAVGPI